MAETWLGTRLSTPWTIGSKLSIVAFGPCPWLSQWQRLKQQLYKFSVLQTLLPSGDCFVNHRLLHLSQPIAYETALTTSHTLKNLPACPIFIRASSMSTRPWTNEPFELLVAPDLPNGVRKLFLALLKCNSDIQSADVEQDRNSTFSGAIGMSHAHNCLLRGLNAIMLRAPHILSYGSPWLQSIRRAWSTNLYSHVPQDRRPPSPRRTRRDRHVPQDRGDGRRWGRGPLLGSIAPASPVPRWTRWAASSCGVVAGRSIQVFLDDYQSKYGQLRARARGSSPR